METSGMRCRLRTATLQRLAARKCRSGRPPLDTRARLCPARQPGDAEWLGGISTNLRLGTRGVCRVVPVCRSAALRSYPGHRMPGRAAPAPASGHSPQWSLRSLTGETGSAPPTASARSSPRPLPPPGEAKPGSSVTTRVVLAEPRTQRVVMHGRRDARHASSNGLPNTGSRKARSLYGIVPRCSAPVRA